MKKYRENGLCNFSAVTENLLGPSPHNIIKGFRESEGKKTKQNTINTNDDQSPIFLKAYNCKCVETLENNDGLLLLLKIQAETHIVLYCLDILYKLGSGTKILLNHVGLR